MSLAALVCGPECKEILIFRLTPSPHPPTPFSQLSLPFPSLYLCEWSIHPSSCSGTDTVVFLSERIRCGSKSRAPRHSNINLAKASEAELVVWRTRKDSFSLTRDIEKRCEGAETYIVVGEGNMFSVTCLKLPMSCNLCTYISKMDKA